MNNHYPLQSLSKDTYAIKNRQLSIMKYRKCFCYFIYLCASVIILGMTWNKLAIVKTLESMIAMQDNNITLMIIEQKKADFEFNQLRDRRNEIDQLIKIMNNNINKERNLIQSIEEKEKFDINILNDLDTQKKQLIQAKDNLSFVKYNLLQFIEEYDIISDRLLKQITNLKNQITNLHIKTE